MPFVVRPIEARDRPEVGRILTARWGSEVVVSRGRVHQLDALPGFLAMEGNSIVGLLTYLPAAESWEVVSLDSLRPGIGVGSALLDSVATLARDRGAHRLWLITTNDNTHALRFYQKRGWRLTALHRGAVAESRKLKAEIPRLGLDGIPIRDELELDLDLDPSPGSGPGPARPD